MLLKEATSALSELYMCTTSTLRCELVSGRFFFFFFFFLNLQTGQKGREVIWGEENSWLLFLSWFSSSGITDLFQPFFFSFAQTRNAALRLPECSQCIRFPVQRARAGKQKQTGSEGRGKWEVTEVRAWRAQMGNGGRMHVGGGCGEMEDTHGSCYYGCYMFHVWLSFMVRPWSTQSLICYSKIKSNFVWGLKVLPN